MRMRMRMHDIYYDVVCINKSYGIVNSAAGFFLMALVSHQLVWVDCLHPNTFSFFSFLFFSSPAWLSLWINRWPIIVVQE